MATKKELRALITLAGKVDPTLQSAMLKATGQTKKLSESYKNSAKQASRLSDIIKGSFIGNMAATGVTYFIGKIKQLGTESLDLASSLIEVQNVVDTTFQSNSNRINKFAKTALASFGLSELQAKQFTGTLGAMFKSSGVASDDLVKLSTDLTGLAGDLASFYNLDIEEAFTKIRSGISGETEPLKQLGINMSVANLEAFAMSKGINKQYKSMSQAEQMLLRYNYLMSVTSDQQGDFAKTSDQYANQQRMLDQNIKQSSATIASTFLPYINEAFKSANKFMSSTDFEAIAEKVGKGLELAGKAIKFFADNVDIILPLMSGLIGYFAAMKIINMGSIFTSLASPIGLAALTIGGLVAAGIALYQNWDNIKASAIAFGEAMKKWGTSIKNNVNYAFDGMKNRVMENFSIIKGGLKSFGNFFIGIYNGIIEKINGLHFDIPKWVPKFGGKHIGFNLQTASYFAQGGIATKPSIFGEAGPEMAIPLKKTTRSYELLYKAAKLLGLKDNYRESVSSFNGIKSDSTIINKNYESKYNIANISNLKNNETPSNNNKGNLIINVYESQNGKSTAKYILDVVKNFYGDPDDEGRLALG